VSVHLASTGSPEKTAATIAARGAARSSVKPRNARKIRRPSATRIPISSTVYPVTMIPSEYERPQEAPGERRQPAQCHDTFVSACGSLLHYGPSCESGPFRADCERCSDLGRLVDALIIPLLKALVLVPVTLLPIINPLSTAPVFIATVGADRGL